MQNLFNLPKEILSQPRFFKVGADKVPRTKAWSNPDNQKKYNEVQGLAGFDTCGHGKADDYLLLDFDHVLNDNGDFVNTDAERWYNFITASADNSYREKSVSGHGLHFILKLTPNKFPAVSGGERGTLHFGDNAKLELFYNSKGRYCLFTGDLFNCPPNAPIIEDEVADVIFQTLLDEIQKRQPAAKQKKADSNQNIFDTPEYNLFRANLMLDAINPAELEDSNWLAVISAAKNIGIDYATVDAFNHRDSKRYNEKENKIRWDSLNDSSYDISTLHGIAKRFNYSEDDAQNQWRQLSTTRNKKTVHKDKTREELEAELALLQSNPKNNIKRIQSIIRQLCSWNRDKYGNPTTIKGSSFHNHKLIFDNDPNLKMLFGRDDFRQETVFFRRATWHSPNAPLKDSWDDTDDAELRMYLRENYAEMTHPQTTFDFLVRIARENSFHAIRRFLETLPQWDFIPRAESSIVRFLGADDTEYTRNITMHMLFGAIARALYPGCDFQSVLVLQGAQGIGKSRFVRMLGGKHGVNPKGENWHIALRDQLDDSHAVDAMRKGWIIEIEEFAAGSRADVNAMKGILSADDVTRRFAYDRRAKTIKSHWIFIATCNDETPLRDQTGARRFLPVKCHNKESQIVEGMTPEYFQQIWAEAYYKFKQMFPTVDSFDADKLRLTPAMQAKAAEFAKGITQDDGMTNEIKGHVDTKITNQIIWHLLSKEERRKFFVDGGSITIEFDDLQARFKNKVGKRYEELAPAFDSACTVKDGFVRKFVGKDGRWYIVFYGSELRQHICASEIFNECFGSDNRKRINRISEILAQLDGWHLVGRLQNTDPQYPDQRKAYYRNNI